MICARAARLGVASRFVMFTQQLAQLFKLVLPALQNLSVVHCSVESPCDYGWVHAPAVPSVEVAEQLAWGQS